MEDVVFTSTATRPGLQEAEVVLTLEGASFPAPFANLQRAWSSTRSAQPSRPMAELIGSSG